MAIINGYATLTEFKAWIDEDVTDLDSVLEQQIEAASRWIDEQCSRQFFQEDAAPRMFDAWSPFALYIDDARVVAEVATDDDDDGTFETVWATSDYQATRAASALPGSPLRRVRAVGDRRFPCGGQRVGRVRVTADWGWATIPDAVHEACLIQAHRLLKRRHSPEGITGFGNEFGHIRIANRDDRDVLSLLRPYMAGVLVA